MLPFYKYHGTGNDFIIFDAFKDEIPKFSEHEIKQMCNRRFGIGADGIMILRKNQLQDFEMEYFNADGSGATMCGNGGRCIVSLAYKLGYIKKFTRFIASDGIHEANVLSQNTIDLKMNDVNSVIMMDDGYFCDTGSPHYIRFVNDIEAIDVKHEGRKIRYSQKFAPSGTNVNFVQVVNSSYIKIRTYERGVEDETLSCGTGSEASALTYADINHLYKGEVQVDVKGGILRVYFEKSDTDFKNIRLIGSATFVYRGVIDLPS
jgi:diaminopimelate epimerase